MPCLTILYTRDAIDTIDTGGKVCVRYDTRSLHAHRETIHGEGKRTVWPELETRQSRKQDCLTAPRRLYRQRREQD